VKIFTTNHFFWLGSFLTDYFHFLRSFNHFIFIQQNIDQAESSPYWAFYASQNAFGEHF